MNLFNNRPRPQLASALQYSSPQQNTTPPPPPPPRSENCDCPTCQKTERVLENQRVIVQNQQVILDAITGMQQYLLTLRAPQEEEVELSEEETAAALAEARRAKFHASSTPTPPPEIQRKRIGRPPLNR